MNPDPSEYGDNEKDGAVFTSSRCPPGPGLDKSCELPFGCIWTPMKLTTTAQKIDLVGEILPPVVCLTCLSYFNCYADIDTTTGIWKCCVCKASNVIPKEFLMNGGKLSGVLSSPVVEFRQQLRPAMSAEVIMPSCTYIFVVDTNISAAEAKAVASAIESVCTKATKSSNLSIGFIAFDKAVSIYQLGLYGIASAAICTIDQVNSGTHFLARKNQAEHLSFLTNIENDEFMPASLYSCLSAVFGISIYGKKQASKTSTESPPKLSRLQMLKQKKEARLRKQSQDRVATSSSQSPWSGAQKQKSQGAFRCTGEAIQCAIDLATVVGDSNRNSARIFLFTDGCPNVGDASVVDIDRSPKQRSGRTALRSTPAIVEAHRLATSVQYFEVLSKYAAENSIGVDIFCTGGAELGLSAYQALVETNGGYVLPVESFETPHLERNLAYLTEHTYMARSTTDGSDIKDGLPDGCVADMRMSSFLSPSHFVGTGDLLEGDLKMFPQERAAFAVGASLAANHGFTTNNLPSKATISGSFTRFLLRRFDPSATLSAMFNVKADMPPDRYAFVQCIVRYTEPDGKFLVTKVSTHRLHVSASVFDFLEGIDANAVAALLGREAVYRSMFGREIADETQVVLAADKNELDHLANDARRDLDATIQRVSGSYRLLRLERGLRSMHLTEEGQSEESVDSSLNLVFPPELVGTLHKLYHLRRGPLLSTGPLHSTDDRTEARSIFMRLPLRNCLSAMQPLLWRTQLLDDATIVLESIPPETLTLWDNCILAADNYDSLFIWSGKSTLSPEYDRMREHCRSFLLDRSKHRFPMPSLHVLSEGDSMSRRFTAVLAPSHADPQEQQVVNFPALSNLTSSEISNLRSKFLFHDAESDPSFRKWFWSAASAANVSTYEGVSLCE